MQPLERVFKFEGFTLDLRRGCLRGPDGEIELRPKSFEVLRYLVENAGRLVPKDEIVNVVWPNVIVSDESLTRCISDVRLALRDRGQRIVRTVPRRGYLLAVPICEAEPEVGSAESTGTDLSFIARFDSQIAAEKALNTVSMRDRAAHRDPSDTAAFTRLADGQEPAAADDPVDGHGLSVPSEPSIAALPFLNLSGDPGQDYFVDGMVEEIITALSRIRWLFVIARNSSFTYKGQAVDVKQVGRELGVRYVLEGSVRKAGARVRITGQLIDTASGAHIWADHFEGALDDIFELQDQVASGVVGAIEPKLLFAEIERATRKQTESLDAYDCRLRALSSFHRLTAEGHREAIRLSEQALELDPRYWPAAAMIGFCRVLQTVQGWVAPSSAEVLQSIDLARRAIEAGKDDPDVLWMAGFTVLHLAGEHAFAIAVTERALVLNPNCAHAWMVHGYAWCFSNQPEPAIDSIRRAIRLSPLDPLAYFFRQCIALAHFTAGRYEEAVVWIDKSLAEQPRFLPAVRLKVALSGYLPQTDEGGRWLVRLRELHPGLTVAMLNSFFATFFSPELRVRYLEGIRKAGLPDE
jgi:TolB-like protein/DNA-binding winged helix-turn-helix (wHTH) protein